MDSTKWKRFLEAFNAKDTHVLEECLEDIEEDIIQLWKTEKAERFEQELRLALQSTQKTKRSIDNDGDESLFQAGAAAGFVHAFSQLYRMEKEQNEIIELLAKSSGKTKLILECLYNEREHGMYHGALAQAINSSPSSLTNLMKRVLQSGAVTASRSGKNTYYMLTAAGEQFFSATNDTRSGVALREEDKHEIARLVCQMLQTDHSPAQKPEAEEKMEPQTLRAGDHFFVIENNVIQSEYQVGMIMTLGEMKYAEFIKTQALNNSAQSVQIQLVG